MNSVKGLLLFTAMVVSVAAYGQALKITNFVDSIMQEYHIPALSFSIIEHGKIKMMETPGMINLEHRIPNSGDKAFQLASVTKLISASAIILLVQKGKLDLHQKVRTYLPELPKSWEDMQVMDLVAHQSGIVDLLALQHNFRSVDHAMDTAMARPLDFEPGAKTVYAGGDYAVVLKLIEEISGKPFQQFLKEEILDALSMRHTVFNNMEQDFIYRTYDTIPYAATVYKWDQHKNRQRIFSMMFPSWTYPGGGLFSSIEDLSAWVVSLDNHSILKPEYVEMMWTPATHRDGTVSPFGVGWIVDQHNGERATGHSGGPALADIVRLPDRKLTVIVLTNQLELRPFLAMKILDLYLDHSSN